MESLSRSSKSALCQNHEATFENPHLISVFVFSYQTYIYVRLSCKLYNLADRSKIKYLSSQAATKFLYFETIYLYEHQHKSEI